MARGIRHLCDEKIKDDEFQYFLNNLEKFEVTEKVDGTNLAFGLDDNGEFYVNRDKKDGRKYGNLYSYNSYVLGNVFSKYFEVLNKFFNSGAIRMERGTKVEVEIIDEPITNVVPYDPRQIIILNVESGEIEIYKNTIMAMDLPDLTWTIRDNRPFKIDGDLIRMYFDSNMDRTASLKKLKKALLDIPSQYGQDNPDSWVEGLVFKSEDLIYKLVNKDRFTIMNKFLHETRAALSAPKPSDNYNGGLYQEMISEIAKFYSVGPLATSQRSKWINENPGWKEQIQLNDGLFYNRNLMFVNSIIEKYLKLFAELKTEYLNTYNDKFIETPYGKCYIDSYTHTKNMAMFDTVETRITEIQQEINNNTSQEIGLLAIRW